MKSQALDAAKEVKRWGEPVTMRPMNSHDRRIVHITLENDPELITESDGDGKLKKVIISLKNKIIKLLRFAFSAKCSRLKVCYLQVGA